MGLKIPILPSWLRKFGPATGPPDSFSRLSHDEATTLMTLWCIDRCPLMFGGNLPETDPFTLALITNPEALAVNQHGSASRQLVSGPHAVWVGEAPRSGKYLALFNRADQGPAPVAVHLADLGWAAARFAGTRAGAPRCAVRDLWAHKDLGKFTDKLAQQTQEADQANAQQQPQQVPSPGEIAPLLKVHGDLQIKQDKERKQMALKDQAQKAKQRLADLKTAADIKRGT